MAKAKRKFQMVDLSELGSALHAALRKCCDSPPTSLVYNLIALDEFTDAWCLYLDDARRRLRTAKCVADVIHELREATAVLDPFRCDEATFERVHKAQSGRSTLTSLSDHARTLGLALRMFSDDDWGGFAAFVAVE